MRRSFAWLLLMLVGLVGCGGGSGPDDEPDVKYQVVGSTDSVSLTYANANEGTSQENATVPWSYTIQSARSGQFLYISAQNRRDSGNVTVRIIKNGKTYRESTSNGAFVIATADGSY